MRISSFPFYLASAILGLLALQPCRAQEAKVCFAVIGDFGSDSGSAGKEGRLVDLIRNHQPPVEWILTVGDNAYSKSKPGKSVFAQDVVGYFNKTEPKFIASPKDDPDAAATRFFPTLGNHDLHYDGDHFDADRLADYRATFALPSGDGRGRFYQFGKAGVVRFFALDSNEVGWKKDGWSDDGSKPNSAQWDWFNNKALPAAKEPWKIVYFHHAPYHSSKSHQSERQMRAWNLDTLGLTAVFAGHVHNYERVMRKEMPFFALGLGGASTPYAFLKDKKEWAEGSVKRYPETSQENNADAVGALFVEATPTHIICRFRDLAGTVIDTWERTAPGGAPPP